MNPKSGKGTALKEKPGIEAFLKTQGKLITYITRGQNDPAHLKELKTSLPQIRTVVVCGGDGTLNLVLNALHSFTDLRFIFLPYGTINIFARENHYPKNRLKALKQILRHGQEKTLFPCFTQNRAFLLLASLGFDSYLVEKVETGGKKLMALSYVLAFIRYALAYNFKKTFQIEIDGKIKEEGSFILIGNCKKYGGFLNFTPQGSFFRDDFDIFIFKGRNFFSILFLIIQVALNVLSRQFGNN